jgi:hypothetical protein
MCLFIIIREDEKKKCMPHGPVAPNLPLPLSGPRSLRRPRESPFPKEPDAVVPAYRPCTAQRPRSTKGRGPLTSVLLRNLDRSYMSEYVSYVTLPWRSGGGQIVLPSRLP